MALFHTFVLNDDSHFQINLKFWYVVTINGLQTWFQFWSDTSAIFRVTSTFRFYLKKFFLNISKFFQGKWSSGCYSRDIEVSPDIKMCSGLGGRSASFRVTNFSNWILLQKCLWNGKYLRWRVEKNHTYSLSHAEYIAYGPNLLQVLFSGLQDRIYT